jgi:hypothetical protein
MRCKNILLISILVIGITSCFFFVTQNLRSGSVLPPIEKYDRGQVIGEGRSPQFISSDTIAFIDNSGFLTIVDLEGKGPKKIGKINALGFRYTGDEFIYWDYQKGDDGSTMYAIRTIDKTGKETIVDDVRKSLGGDTKNISAPIVLPDGTIGYWIEQLGTQYFTILHKGNSPNPLKQWIGDIKTEGPVGYGEVWVRRVDGSDSFRISQKREKYYFPRISFDGTQQCGKKLLAIDSVGSLCVLEFDSLRTLKSMQSIGNQSDFIGEDMTIDTVTYKIVLGGTVSDARWSPNCKWAVCLFQLAGRKDNEDDFNIIGSDVQILSADGSVNIRIETPNVMESNPQISSDGTVVCQNEKGEIVVYRKPK